MRRERPQLAKLTRPRLRGAVERHRLYALLDEARASAPGICIVSPPGAGKTTLVARWLDARSVPGIWYQVDSGDADLATFFYYLRDAAAPLIGRRTRDLPLLTPEYLGDVAAFGRRFFRTLFTRLPTPCVIVLDNYQEVRAEHPFHRLIAQAVSEVPEDITLIAISRRDPPDCYARLIANENVSFVEWDNLRLTLEETRTIATAHGRINDEELAALHARCDGWAAGLTLLLQGSRRRRTSEEPDPEAGRQAVFDYFAAEIFAQVPKEGRRFLMATAQLSQVPVSLARELTGESRAGEILEDLYRRHLFVHRRGGHEPVYWYHALFRDFLQRESGHVIGPEQRREIMQRGAYLFEMRAGWDDAFRLYCDAMDWPSIRRLTLMRAAPLLEQGRSQTLREWIQCLPGEYLKSEPWIRYWLGASLMGVNQQEARVHLTMAFDQFRERADTIGQMRAAASVISSYFFEWADWRPLDRWIAALEDVMLARPVYPSPEVELEAHCSMLIATLYRQPGHSLLPVCVERVQALLDADVGVNHRISAATLLLTYCNLTGRPELGHRIVALAEPMLQNPEVTPLNRIWWCCRLQFFYGAIGSYERMLGPTREALDIMERIGLSGLLSATVIVQAQLAWAHMGLRDWTEAERCVRDLEQCAHPSRPSDLFEVSEARLRISMCQGRLDLAVRASPLAVMHSAATGMVYVEATDRTLAMEAYAEAGLYQQAREQATIIYKLVHGTCMQYFQAEARVIEAYVEHREGYDMRCRSLLAEAFAQARHLAPLWRDGGWLSGRVLAAMCAEALNAGIEVVYVQGLVRRFGLRPPPNAGAAWPWPVQIRTLGRFEILVEGKQLEFTGKAPRKPLLLLKAILSSGGRDVPVRSLVDAIWSDEEGDDGQRALSVALMRLRKLLGSNDAVVLVDGCISVHEQLCWNDIRAFENALAADADCARVLQLYGGAFLAADSDLPWSVRQRERLRHKFIRYVESAGARLERGRDWQAALQLYARGVEADELAEQFYQGLMRCHEALGNPAEGLAVYRRMRQLLSVVLGVPPAPASVTLAQALHATVANPGPGVVAAGGPAS